MTEFSTNFGQIIGSPLRVGTTLWKILDPPLVILIKLLWKWNIYCRGSNMPEIFFYMTNSWVYTYFWETNHLVSHVKLYYWSGNPGDQGIYSLVIQNLNYTEAETYIKLYLSELGSFHRGVRRKFIQVIIPDAWISRTSGDIISQSVLIQGL